MTATVAVIGGGYGGITAAKALDEFAEVILIEPRDTFVHNVAALRALVDPTWTDWLFLPYDQLLQHGRLIKDQAVRVDAQSITLGSGQRIEADYVVLATGSSYPFPAKIDVTDSATAKMKLRATHGELTGADSVLLLGAGPAGLELAGEIKEVWPGKSVTVVDPADDLLATMQFPEEVRSELRRQLDELGVELIFGTSLSEPPPCDPGEAKTFTATTQSGQQITADMWFRCHGVVSSTDYLAEDLAAARLANGQLNLTSELRLPGYENIFAIGDITAVPEAKMAKAAELHAGVVAANIRALIQQDGELTTYEPAPPGISLPLGTAGGVSYAPTVGVVGPEQTSQLKGSHLRYEVYTELLNLA